MSSSFDELLSKIENLGGDIEEGVKKGVGQFLAKVQADAKKLCPTDTGMLRNSIKTNVKVDNKEIIGEVGSDLNYAIYVEMGTGPTGASSKKLLPKGVNPKYKTKGWVYKAKEGYRYTQGQIAKPFLYPAFKMNENNVKEYLKKGVQSYLRGLNND